MQMNENDKNAMNKKIMVQIVIWNEVKRLHIKKLVKINLRKWSITPEMVNFAIIFLKFEKPKI